MCFCGRQSNGQWREDLRGGFGNKSCSEYLESAQLSGSERSFGACAPVFGFGGLGVWGFRFCWGLGSGSGFGVKGFVVPGVFCPGF